jgi:hypothetical protein
VTFFGKRAHNKGTQCLLSKHFVAFTCVLRHKNLIAKSRPQNSPPLKSFESGEDAEKEERLIIAKSGGKIHRHAPASSNLRLDEIGQEQLRPTINVGFAQ